VFAEVLQVVGHVFAGSAGEVEIVDLVDFSDRSGRNYACDLRRYGAYMFATMVVCVFSVS